MLLLQQVNTREVICSLQVSRHFRETKKGFETYLKTLSQPIDLLTRKMKLSILKIRGAIDDNVKAIQDSLCASVKGYKRCKESILYNKDWI